MNGQKTDYWSSKAYAASASFVPALTTKVVALLDPKPTDVILDIGCGDGVLSAKVAASCRKLVGLDASASMIETATDAVASEHANASFFQLDCGRLALDEHRDAGDEVKAALQRDQYDKVFSNATMHWVLGGVHPQVAFFRDVRELLKPGGVFVFEMGGAGNVSETHAALIAVLHCKYHVPLAKLEEADPWFFPSDAWMRMTLEEAGFGVEVCVLEDRPTALTEKKADGSGGLEGWLKLMAYRFLELVPPEERDAAVQDICSVLKRIVTRYEDGSQWIVYRRLRAAARRPA